MSKINEQRMRAEIEGDFVVFLIGMRINKFWKIHKWLPVSLAMGKMLKELNANPALGLLGYIAQPRAIIQYWRSYEHLEAYSRSKENQHLPAWKAFNKALANSREDVGIWHETYLVKAGNYETVYSAMPEFGLGAASTLVPVTAGKESSRERLGDH